MKPRLFAFSIGCKKKNYLCEVCLGKVHGRMGSLWTRLLRIIYYPRQSSREAALRSLESLWSKSVTGD